MATNATKQKMHPPVHDLQLQLLIVLSIFIDHAMSCNQWNEGVCLFCSYTSSTADFSLSKQAISGLAATFISNDKTILKLKFL